MTLSCVDSIGIVTCQITDNKKTGNSISAIPLTLRREGGLPTCISINDHSRERFY